MEIMVDPVRIRRDLLILAYLRQRGIVPGPGQQALRAAYAQAIRQQ